jgi:hypothetical protein
VVRVRSVDPRDIGWEDDAPAFRVTFWKQLSTPVDVEAVAVGHESREYEVLDADVGEVVAWATGEAEVAETWTLHVLVRSPNGELGQVRLLALTLRGHCPRSAEKPALRPGRAIREFQPMLT